MVALHRARSITIDLFQVILLYMLVFLSTNRLYLRSPYDQMLIGADELAHVMFNALIHVAFGVHEELFASGLVFEAKLVEILAGAIL